MKKRSSIFCTFVLVIISLVNINYLAASDRGLKLTVKTPEGSRIDLYRDSYALIVGNSNYSNGWEPIPGAIQDVNEVATALEKHGFNITLKTDLNKDEFSRAINEFSLKYGNAEDNRLLFYYAGHGFTRKMATGEELGYLVMVNAPLPEKDLIGFSINSVDMQSLITQAKIIKARHVLFMFDSCFSGSIISMRERVIPKSISDSVKYPVRQFITAGRANEPVPDHSVFKQAFLDLIEGRDSEPIPDHYITGEELGLYLKTKVPQYNPSQHPQYGKIKDPRLDKGDFVFVLKGSEPIRQPDPQPSELEAEKKRLADETAQIERERQELAQLKLELGKQKLEAESQRLEEEKLKLASIPKTVAVTRILLREKPIVITNQIQITNMLFEYDFFDRYKNPRGSFENIFIDNNDGTITDRATGLMWQKSGSSKSLDNRNIKEYIKRLNTQKLSGYSDWRMPTLEELASLLTRRRKSGVHIDPVFDNKQVRCWSVDQSNPIEPYYSVAWIISFEYGEVTQAVWLKESKAQFGVGSMSKNAINYIKAVRAVK